MREAGFGMDFHDAVPGLPYPLVDLGGILVCKAKA